jgi:hypothetical protein
MCVGAVATGSKAELVELIRTVDPGEEALTYLREEYGKDEQGLINALKLMRVLKTDIEVVETPYQRKH